jgi:addiction module HigA family antidote
MIENHMRPVHPGEILREEFLHPVGLSASALAVALQVPAPRINDIVREQRGITADTAVRLSAFFGNSASFWLGLQADYDAKRARENLHDVLERILRFKPATPQTALVKARQGGYIANHS